MTHNPYWQPPQVPANTTPPSDNVYLSTPQRPHRELHRSIYNRWLGGICGGLAEYFGWSPALVRTLFVLSILIPGPQVIYYIIAWIIVPQQGENPLDKFKL